MDGKSMNKLIVLVMLMCSCLIAADSPIANLRNGAPKIVLITIDGVRWQDIFDQHSGVGSFRPTSRELVPNLYKHFVDEGMAIGRDSQILVSGPAHISQPGYLEIMRGYSTFDCFTNMCPPNTQRTLINEFANNSTVIAGWETIGKIFDNSLAIVNVGRTNKNIQWQQLNIPDPVEVIDNFSDSSYREDRYTTETALAYLNKIGQPQFLWISLGDTDEWAHRNNILFYWSSLNAADKFIGEIMNIMSANTVFIVCPDHGRSDNFRDHGWDEASRRVWIMMTGKGVPSAGFVHYDHNVYLADIYPTMLELTKGIKSNKSLLNEWHR